MFLARSLTPGLALTLLLAACENDPVEPGNKLSEEEAVALLKGAGLVLSQVLEDSTLIVGGSGSGLVARCPLGGQTELVGTVTEEPGDTARLGVDYLITPRECVIAADGIQFTTDPGPALRYQLLVEIVAATFDFSVSGAITGGVDWAQGDRTGNCAMNLTLEAVPDLVNETLTGAYKGTLCGHEVEVDAATLLVVDL